MRVMPECRSDVFSNARMQALQREEAVLLQPFLQGRGGTHALHLWRHGMGGAELPESGSHGYWTRLGLQGEAWSGSVQALACELPFAEDSFALVVASHVLEAVPAHVELCAELARVTMPGARVLLSGFAILHPQAWWMRRQVGRAGLDCHLHSVHALVRLMSARGLEREQLVRRGSSYVLVMRKRRASARILSLPRESRSAFPGRVPVLPGGTQRAAS